MTPDPVRGGASPRVDGEGPSTRSRRKAPLVPDGTRGVGRGLDLTVEFAAAILTWGGIGWLVDQWLGLAPWAMVVGFLLGNGCGIYLMWLRSRQEEAARTASSQVSGITGKHGQ
jgi:F0F1-type ATP synthase assembly protein I